MTKAGLGGEEEEGIVLVVVENGVISLSVGLVDDREAVGESLEARVLRMTQRLCWHTEQ